MIIDVKQLTAIDADSIQLELLYQQKIHEMNCDILKAYAEGNDHFVTVIGPEFEEIIDELLTAGYRVEEVNARVFNVYFN